MFLSWLFCRCNVSEDIGSMVLRRILFKCSVSSVTTCFAGK